MNYYPIHINDSKSIKGYLQTSFYKSNSKFLGIIIWEDEADPYTKLTVSVYPYAKLTVNLQNVELDIKIEPGFAFLNTVEYLPWVEQFVKENELGVPVKHNHKNVIGISGYNMYPLYKFNIDKVFENDLEIKEIYLKKFN